MQSPLWYYRRLRSMSGSELAWRLASAGRDLADRVRFPLGAYPSEKDAFTSIAAQPAFRVTDVNVGEWAQAGAAAEERRWLAALLEKAEPIRNNRLSLFDLENKHLGDPIRWNRDHSAGIDSPMRFAPGIDYRDAKVAGDCKLVWEPSRHHHLVVLGRAYRASGDIRFAQALVAQLESWLDQCPFGIGMNWRSPLELGIRMVSWVWALDLIHESGVITPQLRRRILHSVYLHLWEITRKYSQSSSANNHTIGEAAGVYVAASYFSELHHAAEWKAQARDILVRELFEQTYPSGAGREQAMGYHLFVLHLFLVTALVGRRTADEFPQRYWQHLEKMFDFVAAVSAAGPLPMFGDCDDAYVLDLGSTHGDARGVLSTGAVLFDRPDFKAIAGTYSETTRWLLGRDSAGAFASIPETRMALNPVAFPDAGLYLLQSGSDEDGVSVTFDCGEHGFKSIAAHGHADALAVTLRAFGQDVLVDPGTYDYFTFPEWRSYFRSTRAHNTVEVDGQDQSVMQGPFLWGKRANATCLRWEPGANGGTITAEHDGYRRLQDPVVHRRTVSLDGGTLVITDELDCAGSHQATLYFHLGEQCRASVRGNTCDIHVEGGNVQMEVDSIARLRTISPGAGVGGGWVSRGYHKKSASTTLAADVKIHGKSVITTRIRIEPLHGVSRSSGQVLETGRA